MEKHVYPLVHANQFNRNLIKKKMLTLKYCEMISSAYIYFSHNKCSRSKKDFESKTLIL